MLPLLLAGTVGGLLWHHHRKTKGQKQSARPTQARVKVYGDLMDFEYNPEKLGKAAGLFKQHGHHDLARNLSFKASEVQKQCQVLPGIIAAARANDQNAIGMIAAIREEAAKKNPRAIFSANFIAHYCQKNPPKELGPLGEAAGQPQVAA